MYDKYLTKEDIEQIVSDKIKGSFLYMALALLVTFGIMFYSINNLDLLLMISKSYTIIIVLQLVIAVAMSGFAYKLNSTILTILLLAYAGLTGLTLTSLLLVFTLNSIFYVLISTIVLFSVLASYGYLTKKDFYSFGKILILMLVAIIISSIINIFLRATMLEVMISWLGIIVFMLYTIYDVNNIKNNIIILASENELEILDRVQIIGAFSLYLDFINLFIYMLSIFGKRRD